jgi:hypothetical protein
MVFLVTPKTLGPEMGRHSHVGPLLPPDPLTDDSINRKVK